MNKLPLPKYYIIEATNFCNYRCSICPNRLYAEKDKGNMSIELYLKILYQISDFAEVVQLYWMGEPLLNNHIFEMIALCKENTKAKVMLSTNGSLLTKTNIDRLVKSGLDEIIVSVDAANSQDIYNKIRTGGILNEVNAGINLLLERKNSMRVVVQFIDLFINRNEKEEFITKWNKKDCEISVSCLYTWAGQFPSLNLASENLSPVTQRDRVPCADLWNKLAIHWNGVVSACCFDWNNKLVIGNSATDALIDIWNSSAIQKLRLLHFNREFSTISMCKDCDSWAEPEEYIKLYRLD